MNKPPSGTENEKNKEVKETSEAESYEGYENAAMENAEGSGMEEDWFSENGMSPFTSQSARNVSDTECETSLESSLKNTYEEKKELLLREKWFTITGRKPRNIPIVKNMFYENVEKTVVFGERKPLEVEKQKAKKMMQAVKNIQAANIQYGKIRHEIRLQVLNKGVMCVKFSPDGTLLAYSERTGCTEIRRISTNKVISRLKIFELNQNLPIRSLLYHPQDNEKLYAGGDSGFIQLFDVNSGAFLGATECGSVINVMDINADGNALATGGREGEVCLFDPNTLQSIWTKKCLDIDKMNDPSLEDDYHKMRIYGLKFHPTEVNLFATGGWDNMVKVWDSRTASSVTTIYGPAIYGPGLDITDNIILTASWRAENSLSFWDLSSGQLIKSVPIKNKSTKMEGEFLYAAAFFKNDHPMVNNNMIAVGGSGFAEMLVINIYTEKVERYFPAYKPISTLDIFQNFVVYGGKESTLRVAEVAPQYTRRQTTIQNTKVRQNI